MTKTQDRKNWERLRAVVGDHGVEEFNEALKKVKQLDNCFSYSYAMDLHSEIRDLLEPYAPSKITIVGGTAQNILDHCREKVKLGNFDNGTWLID
jgi:hypothetical protein